MSKRTFSVCLLLSFFVYAQQTQADTPSADYIFPAGGQRGTTVQFRVGAHFLHGGCPIEMRGVGIDAGARIERTKTIWFEGPMIFKPASQGGEVYPKDHLGTVTIARDAAPGVRYWRLWTSQGAVGSRQFIVGNLPEVVEEEIDGRAIPTAVTLPVTINGRMFPREDIDIWKFEAQQGQSITCEVHASRIGSPLDSRLEVRGPDGRPVAENTDHFGSDSFLRFTAGQTGIYQVYIHDSTFRGLQQFVYRLTITSGTFLDRVFPLGGREGSKIRFEFAGQHAPTEPVEVQLPKAGSGDHQQYFPLGESLSNPVIINLSDLDEHIEREPNDELSTENAISLPCVVNGRIEKPGDIDTWAVAAKKDQKFEFDLASARYGSLLDSVLTISDSEGKKLAKVASSENNPIEPKTTFTVPADGIYIVHVKDYRPERGGAEFAYRLRIAEPQSPDFQLRLPSDSVTVFRAAEAKFKVTVQRLFGFGGEIALSVNGLPDGVTVSGTTIPKDKKDTTLVFKAEDKAKVRIGHLKIEGTAKVGEEQQTRTATLPGPRGTRDRDDVLLAVAMPTPFKLDGIDFRTSYAARGTVHRRHYLIHRGDYKGPLTLSLADRQIRHLQGVTGRPMQVAADANEVHYPVNVPTWLEMNRTSRTVVMAVGEVEDEDGVKHKVSFSSGAVNDQIIMLTAPCPLSVRSTRRSIRAAPGERLDLDIKVGRGVLKRRPVKLELLLPKHIRGVNAEPTTIAGDKDSGTLTLSFSDSPGPFNAPVTIRATTTSNNDPVIAETKIEIVGPGRRISHK